MLELIFKYRSLNLIFYHGPCISVITYSYQNCLANPIFFTVHDIVAIKIPTRFAKISASCRRRGELRPMIFHSIEDNRRNKDYFARKDNSTCERLLLIIGGISSAQCIITRLTIFLFPSFPRARSFSVITRFFEDDTHQPPLLESSRMNLNEIRVEFESKLRKKMAIVLISRK